MCVCIYVCIYIYMYIYIYIYIYSIHIVDPSISLILIHVINIGEEHMGPIIDNSYRTIHILYTFVHTHIYMYE